MACGFEGEQPRTRGDAGLGTSWYGRGCVNGGRFNSSECGVGRVGGGLAEFAAPAAAAGAVAEALLGLAPGLARLVRQVVPVDGLAVERSSTDLAGCALLVAAVREPTPARAASAAGVVGVAAERKSEEQEHSLLALPVGCVPL